MNLLCRLLLTLLTAFAHSFSFAQDQIEGFVMRSSSQAPVPFVNIGVIAKGLGTVSDVNGAFKLKYNIVIDDDFAVAVELIENPGNKDHEVYFSVGLFGNVLIQSTSQAKWEKTGTVGPGFNLIVKHDN